MGKRVNLAELAREDIPDSYSTAPRTTRDTGTTPPPAPAGDRTTVPVADVAMNPLNRRGDADLRGEEFEQLVVTVRQHGVLQPIVVCSSATFLAHYPGERDAVGRAHWVALIGNRRLLAAQQAQLDDVPAVVNDDRAATMYEVMLVENSHRRDLDVVHEAEAMKEILDGDGISRRELAGRIGRTHTYVNQRLALLGLIPALRLALAGESLTVETARTLGRLPEEEQEAIAAAGPPYRRRRPGNAVSTVGRRTFSASDPETAAASIRRLFTDDERQELVRLLSADDG